MTAHHDSNTTNRLLRRYLDDLAADPHADPPADLSASDTALARALMQTHRSPLLDEAQRARIWTRAVNVAQQERTTSYTTSHTITPSRNGRADQVDYEETDAMTLHTRSWPRQVHDSRSTAQRGLGTLLLVAAAVILMIAGLLVLRGGADDSPLHPASVPGDNVSGASQQGTPTPVPSSPTHTVTPTPNLPPAGITATAITFNATQTMLTLTPSATRVPRTLPPAAITATAITFNATQTMLAQRPSTVTPTPTATPIVLPTVTPPFGADMELLAARMSVNITLDQMVWSPDGQWVAAMMAAQVSLLDAHDLGGESIVLTSPDITADVSALVFSPDGRYVIAGYEDGTLCWWDVTPGQSVRADALSAPITGLQFSPDGRTLLVEVDGEVQFWAAP